MQLLSGVGLRVSSSMRYVRGSSPAYAHRYVSIIQNRDKDVKTQDSRLRRKDDSQLFSTFLSA